METREKAEAQKRRQDLINATRNLLESNDSITARNALDTVRTEELEELLPEVLVLLTRSDLELRHYAFEFLIDVHTSSLVGYLADVLEREHESDVLVLLISLCWHSPLDYSPLLERLLAYLAHPSLEVVIEAMTSLEIAFDHSSRTQLEGAMKVLKGMQKGEKRQEVRLLLEELQSTCSRCVQQVINNEREEKQESAKKAHQHSHEHCNCGDGHCEH